MRTLFLAENYFGFYSRYLRDHPGISTLSYRRQSAILFRQSFYQSDSHAWALRGLGHASATVIPACYEHQMAWARDHGMAWPIAGHAAWEHLAREQTGRVDLASEPWFPDVLLDQVRRFRPDVVYVFSGIPLTAELIERLRRYTRRIVLQWSCPVLPDVPYDSYDLILSSAPELVRLFEERGIPAGGIRQAFDPRIPPRLTRERVSPTAAAAGTMSVVHSERTAFLQQVAADVPLVLYGPGVEFLPAGSPLRAAHRGEAWGLAFYQAIARHRVSVHYPVDVGTSYAGAKRLFEVTGVGSLLLTRDQPGLDRFFDRGREIVTFRDADECAARIRYFAEHDDEAAAIAAAGHRRTMRDHTFTALAPELEATLRALLRSDTPAPA